MQLEPLEDSIASLAGDNPLDQWAVKAILWARFLDQTGDPDMIKLAAGGFYSTAVLYYGIKESSISLNNFINGLVSDGFVAAREELKEVTRRGQRDPLHLAVIASQVMYRYFVLKV